MYEPPIEYFLGNSTADPSAVERACTLAVSRPRGKAVAVAVELPHVAQAANLLFGTDLGVVAMLRGEVKSLVNQARVGIATGAGEVAVGPLVPRHLGVLQDLKRFLGSETKLAVDITSPDGDADLALAERALLLGVDYVTYSPTEGSIAAAAQAAALVGVAAEIDLGGVKLTPLGEHQLVALREHSWTTEPGRVRVRTPVEMTL